MNAPKVLFVNKSATSESLSHSGSKDGTKIYSHVQRTRRWKNSDHGIIQAKRLTKAETRGRHASWSGDDDSEKGTTNIDQGPLSNQIANGNGSAPTKPSQSVTSNDFASLYKMPQSTEDIVDPFNTTCIVVDKTVHTLLQYYLHIVHPSVWHILTAGRNGNADIFKEKAMTILKGCLSEQYDMYCLLASMNVHMRYLDGYESGKDNDYFMVKAVKASQDYMQRVKQISEQMIFNVFQLSFAEWYRNNEHATLVHFRAAANMARSMGGLRALAKPIADVLVLGDGYIAGELGTTPIFSHTDFAMEDDPVMSPYTDHILSQLLSGSVSVAAGLLEHGQNEIVPTELNLIITDLAVAMLITNAADAGATPSTVAERSTGWIYHRVLVVRHRLLEQKFDDPRSESIKLALLIWILQCFTRAGRLRSAKLIAPKLRKCLQKMSEDSWKYHDEIRLWVMIVGAAAARNGSGDHAWFVQRILPSVASGFDELAVRDDLAGVCCRFFYRDFSEGDLIGLLARDIVKMKRKGTSVSAPVGYGAATLRD
ncbi:hypothetical protein LTR84_008210 [Exophiala bonariae]|uniref:Uncharacterized protein n=1 Tax=Exophiala bonariae TaxID=1690606 RepID=A0AAV9N181_9EURO|nr:hypothetical protein LTR84_008210 [Exophiala bonariae]